jgi:hypothetical protein
MAGTGKSTIARTVAHHFWDKNRLGASFFFSRNNADHGRAVKLFTTLAHQLAKALPDFKRYVCDVIKNRSGIWTELDDQWKNLIIQPLEKLDKRLYRPLVLVFVIDALDECDRGVGEILQLFHQVSRLKILRVRILITSRLEDPIRLGFDNISKIDHQDLFRFPAQDDISLVLKYELAAIKKGWPSDEKIKKIALKANGLFIYAATACRFLRDATDLNIRLDLIIDGKVASGSPQDNLDVIYTQILTVSVIGKAIEEEKMGIYENFGQIVGSVVLLFNPLSAMALRKLLRVDKEKIDKTLGSLHSVLFVPKDEPSHVPQSEIPPIQLLHLSFRDFLLNEKRCRNDQFLVDGKKRHRDLFVCCLAVMSKPEPDHLRRDLCDLRLPGALASEVKRSLVDQCLPDHIQYACCYWVGHLLQGNIELCQNEELCQNGKLCDYRKVYEFLKDHFLHWLEALSLIGKMSEGVQMVTGLSQHLSALPVNNTIILHYLQC